MGKKLLNTQENDCEYDFQVNIRIDIQYLMPARTATEQCYRNKRQMRLDYKTHIFEQKVKELLKFEDI